ncbi:M23 family metallopeptidase [Nocardiopsis sp. NPDC058789]|uniref:M23 family metallopeptidase n=1 Tax=Nocardiopsis eucommiae TaxID=2831970 RepID=A0A975QK80_9ACTN|nr:M23 family metallopeptidase [Nocardiopsis eucommiae]
MRGVLTNLGGPLLVVYFAYVAAAVALDLPKDPLLPLLLLAGVFLVGPRLWTRKLSDQDREAATVTVAPPVAGAWVGLNSPADKVPSHGTHQYGQTYAIDVYVDEGRPPGRSYWWPLSRRPDDGYPAFDRPLLAVADATVVRVRDGQRDHRSRDTWPGLLYLLAESVVRGLGGARRVVGNHVVLDLGDGVYAAYAHLRKGSAEVREGDRVTAGQRIGRCGNSGNSSEPHLHFQLMDHPDFSRAMGLPFRWEGVGVPAAGQTFTALDCA